jgi:hypothetical protein
LIDTANNLGSSAVPPCLLVVERAPCDREGTYWIVVQHYDGLRVGVHACAEHVAMAREVAAKDRTFSVEQVTNRRPFDGCDAATTVTGSTTDGSPTSNCPSAPKGTT